MKWSTKRELLILVAIGFLGFLTYQPAAAQPPPHANANAHQNAQNNNGQGPPAEVTRGPSSNRSDTARGAVAATFEGEPIVAILNTDDEDTLTVVVKIHKGEANTTYGVSVGVACMMPSTSLGEITTNRVGNAAREFHLDLTQNPNFQSDADEVCIQVFLNTSASNQVDVPLKPEDEEEEETTDET